MTLSAHKRDLGRCTYCPKMCRFCCPTAKAEHRETVTPWGKMSLAEMVRQDRLQADSEIGEVFYHCYLCLHCRTHCTHGVDVPGALVEARYQVFKADAEPSAVNAVIGRFRDTGNAWGSDLRAELAAQVGSERLVPEAQAVLFAGCDALRLPGYVSRAFELLDGLGVDTVGAYDGDAMCCGVPLWQAGDLDGFRAHAEHLRTLLSRYRKIVCPCPTCVHVLRGLYPALDLAPGAEVVHLIEFVAPLLADREPVAKLPGAHVFHDPCYLARFLEQPGLPRSLLERVLSEPLRDLIWSKDDAPCCGGGGLVPHVLPDVSATTAAFRARQLKDTGAERVVTACPGCVRQLGSAPEGEALPVSDIAEILLLAYVSPG